MNQIKQIKLISKEYTLNAIGVPVAREIPKTVFASMYSVSQVEFYRAGQEGLKPQAVYAVRFPEYSGEDEIEADGERFTVYRTYIRVDGRIELYVTKRKGEK